MANVQITKTTRSKSWLFLVIPKLLCPSIFSVVSWLLLSSCAFKHRTKNCSTPNTRKAEHNHVGLSVLADCDAHRFRCTSHIPVLLSALLSETVRTIVPAMFCIYILPLSCDFSVCLSSSNSVRYHHDRRVLRPVHWTETMFCRLFFNRSFRSTSTSYILLNCWLSELVSIFTD